MFSTRRYAVVFGGHFLGRPAVRRAAFSAFLLALLGYGGFLAYYTLAHFDVVNLHRDGVIDDAFYYFEIAKNLATGEFSTFDGGITRTNGYHPIWVFLITPLYWLCDTESALFGIKALEVMLIAGSVALVAVAVRLAALPWILLFAALPALYHTHGMLLGLEAGAGAFALGAFAAAAVLSVRDPARWRGILASIAFLLPWVRLEYVAIALFVTGALHLLPPPGLRWPGWRLLGWSRLRSEGLPIFAAVAGILAYFLYNGIVFGGIVPISGTVKLAWSADWRQAQGIVSLWDYWPMAAHRFGDVAHDDLVRLAELCCYTLAALAVAAVRCWPQGDRQVLAMLVVMLALGLEAVAVRWQIALLYSPPLSGYTYWYYVPAYLLAALMLPLRCFVTIHLWRVLTEGRDLLIRQLGMVAICVTGVYLAFDRHSLVEPFRFVQEKAASSQSSNIGGLAQEAAAFDRLLPDGAILGSWDAGAHGYFSERPVVNMDGLANSYHMQQRSGDWAHWSRLWGVTYFVNVHRDADTTEGEIGYVGTRLPGNLSVKLWAATDGGRSKNWMSITVPALTEAGADSGLRLLRFGRLFVMFVPDCQIEAVSNVPEMLTFSWQEGARRRRESRIWPPPFRTELGYCTARFLLPHSAIAEDVAVDGATVDRVVAGKPPIVRSAYTVYAVGRQLIYIREACAGDTDYSFLHAHPAVRRDLPYHMRQFGFHNLDPLLNVARRVSGGRCLASVELPAYEIAEVWTGQTDADGVRTWQARIDGLALRPASVDAVLGNAEPIAQGDLNVHLDRDGRKLLYIQASGGTGPDVCRSEGVFLNFHPRRLADLPTWQQQQGFVKAGFDFAHLGFVAGDRCVVAVPLPDLDLDHLNTGLVGTDGHSWRAPRPLADLIYGSR